MISARHLISNGAYFRIWSLTFAVAGLMPAVARGEEPWQPPSTIYVYDYSTLNASPAQREMMTSVAGIVNRTSPELLFDGPGSGDSVRPGFWLNQLKAKYPSVQSVSVPDPTVLLAKYRSQLKGYVYYDKAVNPHSVNVATTLAGIHDALMVSPSTLGYATALGLAPIADNAMTMSYTDVQSKYASQLSKQYIFHHPTYRDVTLRDFAIAKRGFMYDQPANMGQYLKNQAPHSRILGWNEGYAEGAGELDFFRSASQNQLQAVPANHLQSASALGGWKVPIGKQRTHTAPNVQTQPGKHYVAFVMSDGDNATYVSNGMPLDARNFGSPHRGKFTMNWDMSPSMTDINPLALNYLYENASNTETAKDFFVTGMGHGVIYPSEYPDTAGFMDITSQAMADVDQNVLSVLDNTYELEKLKPMLEDPQVLGMMYKTNADYYAGQYGQLDWHEGKPILSVKYSLWDGHNRAVGIAAALNDPNRSPRDPLNNEKSYTIVNVHPWSVYGPTGAGSSGDPMSNLEYLTGRLNSDVSVVTLEEMFTHMRNNFGTPVPEPGSLAVLALFGAACLGRRRV